MCHSLEAVSAAGVLLHSLIIDKGVAPWMGSHAYLTEDELAYLHTQ